MFVWNIQASAVCRADPELAYTIWTDVQHWSTWDHEIEWAKLDGNFCVGATGTIKLRGVKPAQFRIAYVEKNRRFSIIVKKFLTTIACTCEIQKLIDRNVQITQRIIVGGMLAPIYKRMLGKRLQKSLPVAINRLIDIIARHV